MQLSKSPFHLLCVSEFWLDVEHSSFYATAREPAGEILEKMLYSPYVEHLPLNQIFLRKLLHLKHQSDQCWKHQPFFNQNKSC